MSELAIVVTMPECLKCELAKIHIKKMGYEIAEISHEQAIQRSDQDEYMAALADNNMAFPMVMLPFEAWRGWHG